MKVTDLKLISFVIPCYRSENTIEAVINEIVVKVRERPEFDYEIVAVNDCSPDGVMNVLRRLARENVKVKVLDLARNVGKHAAILAGFHEVSGEYIVNLDDDGQCPIDRLWDLLEPLENGHDMAMAHYHKKIQNRVKNIGSWLNDKMSQTMLEKPKGLVFSNFIARQAFVCKAMASYIKPFPYLEGLLLKTTTDIVLVQMKERERMVGHSGYTLKNSLALWVNGLTAFSVKPLRVAMVLGVVFAFLGFAYGIITVLRKILHPNVMVGYSSILVVILFCSGIIMILLGMIGEYVGRIFIAENGYLQYVIKERIN